MRNQQHKVIDGERAVFFDKLAETWDSSGPPPATTIVESFLHKLNLLPGFTILDVGTGTGMLIPYLFQYEPAKVYALDLSRAMLAKLTQKYKNRFSDRLIAVQGDVHCLEFGNLSIDTAICNGVYPHFYDKPLALAGLYRVLKPGGLLAINHFASKNFINSIHTGSSHELIRQDLLESVETLTSQVQDTGFQVRETADNELEYYVIARKPNDGSPAND